MPKYIQKQRRQWLNSINNHNKGHIQWGYKYATKENGNDWVENTFEFILFDCARSISLSLGVYTKNERNNSINKLRIIRDACDELIDAMSNAETETERKKRMKIDN